MDSDLHDLHLRNLRPERTIEAGVSRPPGRTAPRFLSPSFATTQAVAR